MKNKDTTVLWVLSLHGSCHIWHKAHDYNEKKKEMMNKNKNKNKNKKKKTKIKKKEE